MASKTIARRLIILAILAGAELAAALPLSTSASAQFFPLFDDRPRRQQPSTFPLFGPFQPQEVPKAPPVDYSKAPAPRKVEVPPTATIVVMGDSLADWLAYGLEDAFTDTPEIGIVRKHRTYSGLIRYDTRGDLDWPHVARDLLAAEKPSAVVMMVGLNDRQAIREKPPARGAAATAQPAPNPDQQPQNQESDNPELQIIAPEPSRPGTYEFRSERWNELYIKRVDDTIASLKSKGVPVIWVGLPSMRGPKATTDTLYLNDLYRARAEKAGIIYVDVWDGFIDEAGKFAAQGPDVEGQIRRLRAGDGVHFTKSGARKLAHYVEREIRRVMSMRSLPVAYPSPEESTQQPQSSILRPGIPTTRPLAGAVMPLTNTAVPASDELLGGGGARPAPADPLATRVLVKGEPVAPPKGRADDFGWPARGAGAAAQPAPENTQAAMPAQSAEPPAAQPAPDAEPGRKTPAAAPAPKKPKPPGSVSRDVPRPPASVGASASAPPRWFR
jgi:hypothetical protein